MKEKVESLELTPEEQLTAVKKAGWDYVPIGYGIEEILKAQLQKVQPLLDAKDEVLKVAELLNQLQLSRRYILLLEGVYLADETTIRQQERIINSLKQENILLKAERDGIGSQLLDLQKDCIALKQEKELLLSVLADKDISIRDIKAHWEMWKTETLKLWFEQCCPRGIQTTSARE